MGVATVTFGGGGAAYWLFWPQAATPAAIASAAQKNLTRVMAEPFQLFCKSRMVTQSMPCRGPTIRFQPRIGKRKHGVETRRGNMAQKHGAETWRANAIGAMTAP